MGFGCFADKTGNCRAKGLGAVAPQAWRARTPRSGTPHGCSPFTHPPPPPALPNKAPLQSRAAPRRANGQEGSVSPTSLRCLVPESTTLLGRSVAPAFLTHTGRVHRHLQGGGGKMASTAAPGGGARARTQAQKESLGRREPRGRGGAAAKSRRGASGRLGDPVRHACTAPARYFQECAGCF